MGKNYYDAVMISTGPSREIDKKRTLDAITRVKEDFLKVENYCGLWVPTGTLGGLDYEKSQRKAIYDLMVASGVSEKKIKEIGGNDTIHKTKLIIDLAKEKALHSIGISTYWTHFLRYHSILNSAKKENYPYAEKVDFIHINSSTIPFSRKPLDFLYGILSFVKEKHRIRKFGFEESAEGARVAGNLTDKFKDIAGRE